MRSNMHYVFLGNEPAEVARDITNYQKDNLADALANNEIPPAADVAFCLDGACAFVNGKYEAAASRLLKLAICSYDPIYFEKHWDKLDLDDEGSVEFIYLWNDAEKRKLKDILAVLDIAIKIAKKMKA